MIKFQTRVGHMQKYFLIFTMGDILALLFYSCNIFNAIRYIVNSLTKLVYIYYLQTISFISTEYYLLNYNFMHLYVFPYQNTPVFLF